MCGGPGKVLCSALSPALKRHYFGGFVPANLDKLNTKINLTIQGD